MAVAFDAVATDTTGGAANLTYSHTCTGSNLVMYVLCGQRFGTSGVSAVTYNAVSLTKLFEFDNGNLTSSIVYRLINPATGAHNVIVTEGGSRAVTAVSVSFTGVDQTTPEGVIVPASPAGGHDTAPTHTVASAVGDMVVDLVSYYMPAAETVSVGAGQTLRGGNLTTGTLGSAVSTEAGAASVVMSWTASASVWWNHVAIPIKAGGAGAGGSPLSAVLQMMMGDGS